MQLADVRIDSAFAPEHWPVFGHGSPWRPTRAPLHSGDVLPADTVDQEFEEYFFE
jgi:hypothetical protein